MLEVGFGRDSDGDNLSLETANSSQSSSMSGESCSCSFGRLSFEAAGAAATATSQNDNKSSKNDNSSRNSLTVKPHRSSDSAYSAIRTATVGRNAGGGGLSFRDFRVVRRIGSGDIGTVYLCCLKNSGGDDGDEDGGQWCDPRLCYAMKVVDKDALAAKNKVHRAEMERKILKMLDHPFLPTLYAEFEASHFSCFVMEFCSGGDLHSLRHKQPHKRFSLNSARFYAAEVLVALEYLHMLGIIYRDLKPENVLVRSDGHIMLSDFDLSLCSDAVPAVESHDSSPSAASPPTPSTYTRPHPAASSPFSCFPLFRSRRVQTAAAAAAATSQRLFVAEPVAARSCSFVGTHEYVSPEVASGGSHGNAVDWWAYGVFLYEMVYGRTPFAAQSNEATLINIVKKPLSFPTPTARSALEHHARDLITLLLEKDPARRLGSKRGSAEVKGHPFFKGVSLALIRSSPPPEVPGVMRRQRTTTATSFGNRRDHRGESTAFDYF